MLPLTEQWVWLQWEYHCYSYKTVLKCQDEDNSLERLDKVIGGEFVPIPPLSFYGKTHTKENANHPFAMAIDKLWES